MDGKNYMLVLVLVQLADVVLVAAASSPIAKPGCKDECGGVKIPYPFGIAKAGCFYNSTTADSYGNFSYGGNPYNITCNTTTNPPTPSTYYNGRPVVTISLDDHSIRVTNRVSYDCSNQSVRWLSIDQFRVSPTRNKFVAIGCDNIATIFSIGSNKSSAGGCMAYCTSMEDIQNNTCSGVGCCNVPIPAATTQTMFRLDSYQNHSQSPFNPCSVAFVVEEGAFTFSTAYLTSPQSYFEALRLPAVLDWSILGNQTCATTALGKLNCGRLNTQCIDGENATPGYRCKCSPGYTGNPYLPDGCDQDVNECADPNLNDCEKTEYCVNKQGGYECVCPKGLNGKATKVDPCKSKTSHGWDSWPTPLKLTLYRSSVLDSSSLIAHRLRSLQPLTNTVDYSIQPAPRVPPPKTLDLDVFAF